MSLRWQFEAKLFTSNYTNRVVHVFEGGGMFCRLQATCKIYLPSLKLFFFIVSFIYVKTNLYFWSRS